MNINYAKIVSYTKNMKTADFVYPGIFILFFIATITTFFLAARFITANINKIFSIEGAVGEDSLNTEHYTRVAKKLNIPFTAIETTEQTTVSKETPKQESVATTTIVVGMTATSTPPLDKKAITLLVKNSTPKKGVANTLAKSLEDAGFQKPQTGNESKSYATTTILIKESKKEYGVFLLETIQKAYPDAVVKTSSENSSSDATIVIGTH